MGVSIGAALYLRRAGGWAGIAAAVVAAALVVAVAAGPAAAHAFLVDSDPPHGARLADPPSRIALQATEPLAEVVRFDLRGRDGPPVATTAPRLTDGAHVAVVDAPADLPPGVYTVAWHVVSAVDGHESSGEFAFAAGVEADGALPAAGRLEAAVPWGQVVASWLFFVGLAAAGGALVVEHLFGARRVPLEPRVLVRLGLLVAVAAILLRGGGRDGSFGGGLVAGGVALLATSMVAAGLATTVWPALVLAGGAAAMWALHGHAAATAGAAGAAVDLVHLLAGSLWAGALVLVAAIWLRTPQQERAVLLDPTRRYAQLALALVMVLAAAGVVSALQLLDRWGALWRTVYGGVILVKTAAFAVALALAAVARRRLFGGLRRSLLRPASTEATLVVVAVAAAAVLVNLGPPTSPQAAALLGPPPMVGPVARDAGLAGQLTVSVAAGGGRLDVLVFVPSGGVRGTRVDVSARFPDGSEVDLNPRGCGAGCFTQELPLPDGVSQVSVDAEAPGWVGGSYRAGLRWPAAESQPALLDRTVVVMRNVDRLYLQEATTSGPGSAPLAGFPEPAAPGEPPAGTPLSGTRLMDLEPYGRGRVTDVRPLPGNEPGFTFYLPGSRIFGTLWLDEHGRIQRARLVTPSHEILRTLTYTTSRPRGLGTAEMRRQPPGAATAKWFSTRAGS